MSRRVRVILKIEGTTKFFTVGVICDGTDYKEDAIAFAKKIAAQAGYNRQKLSVQEVALL